jgi:hypothetical protein
MKRLSQHGGWDASLEASVREKLDLRFSEMFEGLAFAQACQRSDGSVYGTTGQCRKGTPITLSPEEGMPALYKKAVAAGLKGSEVKAIADGVREKFGVKQIKKGAELAAVFEEVKKRLGEEVKPDFTPAPAPAPTPKPASAKPSPAPTSAPKPKSEKVSETEKTPSTPSSKVPSKISDERVKAVFNRALDREAQLKEQAAELSKQGKDWRDPEVKALTAKIGKASQAALLMRQAYYAQDRDAFLKATGEKKKLTDESDRLTRRATQMAEKDGFNAFNTPKDHPSKPLAERAIDLRIKANDLPRDRVNAAYFGEPVKLSKAPSDGGGKVDAAVPTRVPRGGADKDLKDFLDGAVPVMAFNEKGFAKFVKEGEAKNGFEAGTGGIKKGKSGYLEGRRSGEEAVMGISKLAPPKERPVYAALEHPDRARSLQGGPNQMAQYGGVQVVFNNSVKDRATFTIGDSLDAARPRGIMASPVRDPANPTSPRTQVQDIQYNGGLNSQRMSMTTSMDNGIRLPSAYVEAQIHGGLRTSDIKEVRYYRGHDIPPAARKALEKQGVRIVELPPQMDDLKLERTDPNYRNIEAISPFYNK